jgi:hypothetical protein
MMRSIFAVALLAFSAAAVAGKPIIIIDKPKAEPEKNPIIIIDEIRRIVLNPIIIIER